MRLIKTGGCLILAGLVSMQIALADVLPAHSTVEGKTLAQWSADWWQWALSFPASNNPLLDDTGANAHLGDVGSVFFLAGGVGGSIDRTFTVPKDKFVFLPVLNTIFVATDPGDTLQVALEANAAFIATVSELHANIDEAPVPNLFDHRETTLSGFNVTLPDDNLLGIAAGVYGPAASDGFWLMLEPLSEGSHIINFGGTAGSFSLDVTDRVTVSEPSTFALLGIGIAALLGCCWRAIGPRAFRSSRIAA